MIDFKGFILNSFGSGINLSDRNAQIFHIEKKGTCLVFVEKVL